MNMNATSVKMDNNFRSFKRLCKKIIKGKAFQKDEFGTGLFDLTLRGAIRKQQNRPEGSNNVPAKLLLSPVDGNRASKHATTRIFIGSEDAQHRAERVLLWSILKHRDPEKYYEVRIMKDLEGFDRKYWKTGFTGYRYAIPEFAGIATQVGQEISAALAGQQSVEEALEKAQALTVDEMEAAGY